MNDSEFMLKLLSDGKEHSTMDIIYRSLRTRGCGITPHSRASDLRRKGHNIECIHAGKVGGRSVWVYKLVGSLPSPRLSADVVPSPRGQPVDTPHDPHSGRRGDGNEPLFTYPRSPEWA